MKVTVSFEQGSDREFIIGQDGNQVTAVKPGFQNLQEDNCGFGDTVSEAVRDLCRQEHFGRPMDIQID